MRPVRLEMEAFGSYARHTVIDFTKTQQNLFLVSGATGSGKSTIFDAIVFALYGEASANREKKEGVMLQSQFAALDQEPKVVFVFQEQGEKQYKITRIPKHYRKAKRRSKNGSNMVLQQGSIELTMPDGTIIANKQVQDRIEEIVGLSKQQFMQVGMIAQGEFMDMLRANTKDKLEIFRKLFHTDIFRDITEEIKHRKDAKGSEMAKLKTQCLAEIEHIRLLDEEMDIQQEYQAFYEKLQVSLAELEPFIQFLEKLCQFQKDAYLRAKEEWKNADASYEKVLKTYSKASYLKDAFLELEQAEAMQITLQAQEKERKEQEERVCNGKKTYDLLPFYQECIESQKRLARYQKEVKEESVQLANLKKEREICENEKETLAPVWQAQSEAYVTMREKVASAREHMQTLLQKRTLFAKESADYKKWDEMLGQNTKKLLEKEQKLEKTQKQWKAVSDSKAELANCLHLYEKAQVMTKKYASYDALQAQMEQQKTAVVEDTAAYEQAKQKYQQKLEIYEQLQQQFLDNQAGVLAETLVDGQPCPVCGSCVHPHIYQMSKAVIPSQQEVEIAKEQKEEAATQQMQKAQTVSASRSMYEQLQQQIADFCEQELGVVYENNEECQSNITKAKQQHKQQEQKLYQQWKKKQEDVDAFGRLEKEMDTLTKECQQEKEEIEQEKQQLQEKKDSITALQASISECKKVIPFNIEETQVTTAYQKQKTAWEQVEQAHLAVIKKIEAASAKIQKGKELIAQEKETFAQKSSQYENEKTRLAITETLFLEIKEQYSKEQIEREEQSLREYYMQVEETKKTVARTKELVKGKEKPDMMRLQEQITHWEVKRKQAEEKKAGRKHCLLENEQVLQNLQEKMQSRQETHKQYAMLERLYQVASGQVKGQNKMDIETFVQRYYLNQVLQAANKRFLTMSAGQFVLSLKKMEESSNARNEGLDLMVHSLVTNTYREVHTLSGGESFMAALSLALGMADMIQNTTSAIHLDMMFIDEGFGSLDEEARNQAVKILKELAGGERLIGIISHVTELKNQIDDQLLVEKDRQGSRVKWAEN